MFAFSIVSYFGIVGMITSDIVSRKSLNQESQKIASYIAHEEEILSRKTKELVTYSSQRAHIAGYIDPRTVEAIGLAQ